MKKKYLKPEAEYVSLEAEDVITIIGGELGGEEDDGSWEESGIL